MEVSTASRIVKVLDAQENHVLDFSIFIELFTFLINSCYV